MAVDIADRKRPQRSKDFYLFIPDPICLKHGRRLHGGHGQKLQYVILKHVSQDARLFIVERAVFHTQGLGGGDLYVINVLAVPYRLKYGVGKPKHQYVLNCFFGKIVIDSIDLIFAKVPLNVAIQMFCAFKVSAKRLFDYHTGPSRAVLVCKTSLSQVTNDVDILCGWHGKVEQSIC